MKNFTLIRAFLCLSVTFMLFTGMNTAAQSVTLTPATSKILAGQSVTFSVTTSGFGGNDNDRSFDYAITGTSAFNESFNCTRECNSESHSITFPSSGTYNVSVTVTRTQGSSAVATSGSVTVNVLNPNLWAVNVSGSSSSVLAFNAVNGSFNAGPLTVFNLNQGEPTAAVAMSLPQDSPDGIGPAVPYFYWLQNTTENDGVVRVYGATATGSNQTFIGSLDLNGSSNTSLGFVRLGMGPDGVCYILAGNGSNTVYLASFKPSGVTLNSALPATDQLKLIDANGITLSGGTASEFQNGDLAVLNDPVNGGVRIFALANITGGATKIFVGRPNGNNTTFTKSWDLVSPGGGAFTGSVNGVAFDNGGSMYLSTGSGIFFVDANTVNNVAAGTVTTTQSWSGSGLTDLATNFFPANSSLPVTLVSFNGSLKNNTASLQWRSQHEIDFDHYVIERSENNAHFSKAGKVIARGTTNGEVSYAFSDDLFGVNGKTVFYRLKMVDTDGKFRYSNVIVLRRDANNIKGLSLAPNPIVSGQATLRVDAERNTDIQIRIMDLTGKVITQQKSSVNEGVNSISLNNISQLLPGSYLLQVAQEGNMSTLKFTVIK